MAKYRHTRTDMLTHPKMQGLHPLDRDIFTHQIVAANIAGILRKSERQIANDCGGGTTPEDVSAALERLSDAGVVRWWPDLELVWAVEAADEQAKNDKAWSAVWTVLDVQPAPLKEAFAVRYADKLRGDETPPPAKKKRAAPKAKADKPAPKSTAPERPKTEAEAEAHLRHQVAVFRERVLHEVARPKPPGRSGPLGVLIVREGIIIELLQSGETVEGLVQSVAKLSARVSSGELPQKFWGAFAFTGLYSSIRDGNPIEGHSRPVVALAPEVETEEAARRYADENGGALPNGWQWTTSRDGKQVAERSVVA